MTNQRRVRIVATIGPAADRPDVMNGLLQAGINVARINLSHGTPAEHVERVQRLRATAANLGREIAVLGDLPGPKLRVVLSDTRVLERGHRVTFCAEPNSEEIGVTDAIVLANIRPGHLVLLDDGRLQLRIESVAPHRVVAQVLIGGQLQPGKGFNLPETPLDIPALTDRDLAALKTAAAIEADMLALSFVQSPEAANELRRAARIVGLDTPIIAKIERPEAVQRITEIIAAFDCIMVARGDLGVELPLEQVPTIQKRLIAAARAHGKPVITATDMLDSMRKNPRPTRAEASDVANAIYDGTDAVMLSGETAVGDYPIESVICMDRIARHAEADTIARRSDFDDLDPSMEDDLAGCACQLAETTKAAAIIVPTLSGSTAMKVARHRPNARIIAPVPTVACQRRLALVWGVQPVSMNAQLPIGTDRIGMAVEAAFAERHVQPGDRVVVLAGHPLEGGARWPTIRLVYIGANGMSDEP